MKTITKYKSYDDMEFLSKDKCLEHEENCKLADWLMKNLPERPDGCSFSNGEGYIQHDNLIIIRTKKKFLEFVKRYTDHKWIKQSIDDCNLDPSWAYGIISECCPQSISKHWYRFMCIDNDFKEWGHPYYASHQNEVTDKQLN